MATEHCMHSSGAAYAMNEQKSTIESKSVHTLWYTCLCAQQSNAKLALVMDYISEANCCMQNHH